MPTIFNSADLFASGPHRFHVGPAGSQAIDAVTVSPTTPGKQVIGPLTPAVAIRGRLVADNDGALWSLIDAVHAQLTDPPTVANLADPGGRVFADMSFVTFKVIAPFDRGRASSVSYEAIFLRLP